MIHVSDEAGNDNPGRQPKQFIHKYLILTGIELILFSYPEFKYILPCRSGLVK